MALPLWTENHGEGMFEDLDMRKLKIDEAYVRVIHNNANTSIYLYGLIEECVKVFLSELRKLINFKNN